MVRIVPLAAAALLTVTGCGALAVEDPHADIQSRMWNVTSRFEQDRHQGGMSGVIADIQDCYRSASQPVVKIYALRDCIALDDTGYKTDVTIGRLLNGGPLPFFADHVFAAPADHYAQLDGFTGPDQLAQYLRDSNAVVQTGIAQLNAAPLVLHHPNEPRLASHL